MMLEHTKKIHGVTGLLLLLAVAQQAFGWTVENRLPAFQFEQAAPAQIPPLLQATQPWRLCALYPHLKDSYWLSINYGMVQQAKRLDIALRVAEAGGYHQLERQWQQVQDCITWRADAILLGTVAYEEINRRLDAIADSTPLFGLVNNLASSGIKGRVGVPWYRMGYLTGAFLANRHPPGSPPVTIAWFPGPEQRGGTPESGQGLRQALQQSSVELIASSHGDNDRNVQRTLLQQVLDQHPDLDYIVGSAVLAEVAVNELRKRNLSQPPQIISHYLSHGVYRGLKRGKILMVNTDQMVLQGRLAVDQSVRYLEGMEYHKDIGPPIIQLTHDSQKSQPSSHQSLSPAGFTPTYSVVPTR